MWLLVKVGTDEKFILLRKKNKYTVGRAGSDLALKDDSSISRSHANLYLLNEDEVLEFEDSGSKYGTFYNQGIASNKAVKKNEKIILKPGDQIRFGLLQNVWTLNYVKLAVIKSALTGVQTNQLQHDIKLLGGKVLDVWDSSCTHLTMCDISITVKLLHALLSQLPIVTCRYWTELLKAAHGRLIVGELPAHENFAPKSQANVDLRQREERKTLFKGMVFVFLHRRQFEMYAPIIEKAGGSCKDLNSGVQKTFLTKPNVIVVQYIPSTQSQSSETFNSISDYLERNSKRIIPEYEIGLAIVHCSTKKYCNCYILDDLLLSRSQSKTSELPTQCSASSPEIVCTDDNIPTEVFVPESDNNEVVPEILCSKNKNVEKKKLDSDKGESINKRKRITTKTYLSDSDDNGDDVLSIMCEKPYLEKGTTTKAVNVSKPADSTVTTVKKSSTKRNRIEICDSDDDVPLSKINKNSNIEDDHTLNSGSQHFDNILPESKKENTTTKCTTRISKRNKVTISGSDNENDNVPSTSAVRLPDEIIINKTVPERDMTPAKLPVTRNKKATPKALPITVGRFLEKSQPNENAYSSNKNHNLNHNVEKSPQKLNKKRSRITVLVDSDGDDDNENLFNFRNSKVTVEPKKSRIDRREAHDDNSSDNELFGFTKRSKTTSESSTVVDPQTSDNIDHAETEALVKANQKPTTNNILPKPKKLPQKVCIDGWYSCRKTDIDKSLKDEKDVNDNKSTADGASAQLELTFKGGFEVRFMELRIKERSANASNIMSVDSNTMPNNNHRKNFKTFVNKQNLFKQMKAINHSNINV